MKETVFFHFRKALSFSGDLTNASIADKQITIDRLGSEWDDIEWMAHGLAELHFKANGVGFLHWTHGVRMTWLAWPGLDG